MLLRVIVILKLNYKMRAKPFSQSALQLRALQFTLNTHVADGTKGEKRMKAEQRLFSLAGLAPGTSFKWVDDQFPVCFKFSGKKFYILSQSWMCLKCSSSWFFFLWLCHFVLFLNARLCRRHLSSGSWKGSLAVSLRGSYPCSQPLGTLGLGNSCSFSPSPLRGWARYYIQAQQHPKSRRVAKATVSHAHLKPFWLPALLGWFKADEIGKVCVVCPLHLLLVFPRLRDAKQHILSTSSPSCVGLLHKSCGRSQELLQVPHHAACLLLLWQGEWHPGPGD